MKVGGIGKGRNRNVKKSRKVPKRQNKSRIVHFLSLLLLKIPRWM
jgi:hypothetical protein